MYLTIITDLYDHMEWADAIVWRGVMTAPSAEGDQKLTELFHHLHLVQHAYLQAWRGEPFGSPFPSFDTTESLLAWGRSFYPQLADFLKGISDEKLAQLFEIPWTEIVANELGQTPAAITLGESMMQVPLHSHYHRGQINTRLRAAGGEPPRVDYVVWVWLGRPKAQWPNEPRSGGI